MPALSIPTARTDRDGAGRRLPAEREYVHPTVRARATPSAHPSSEAWPSPAVKRPASSSRLRARRTVDPREDLIAADAAMRTAAPGRSVVVIPSRSIDPAHDVRAGAQAMEERLMCTVLMLRDPGLSVTYVTSSPIAAGIVDYYLSHLPRALRGSARARLTLLSTRDDSLRPLSEKLLEQPLLVRRIRNSVARPELSHLMPYETTVRECELAAELGLPMYGADPRHAHYGTKSGCRELFAAAGAPHPAGVEHISDLASAIRAIVWLRRVQPGIEELVVKLNEGVAGRGNAILDVCGLPEPGAPDEAARIAERLERMTFESLEVTLDAYLAQLAARGGIAEQRIVARELHSPSVQLQLTPGGGVEVVSTHDQLLGGRGGQSYLGCCFPAAPAYVGAITQIASRVGRRLADAGVIGRCAIDFVVAREADGAWRPYAIELNLRRGGTTHPFMALEALTGGAYDAERAGFTAPTGGDRHYVATDHLEAPELRALGSAGVLGLARSRELSFDRGRGTGVVFHMFSSLDDLGSGGFTAVGDTREQASRLYERTQEILLERAVSAPAAIRRRSRTHEQRARRRRLDVAAV